MYPFCKKLISQGSQINPEIQIYRKLGFIGSDAHETAWLAKEL